MSSSNINIVNELNERSRDVFRELVEAYVANGEPVGSRTLSRRLQMPLSPATIRNVMSDLEDMGLLYAPHKSAGRLPTDAGLRMFVDGLLEIGDLSSEDRESIEAHCITHGTNLDEALGEATFKFLSEGQFTFVIVSEEDNTVQEYEKGAPASSVGDLKKQRQQQQQQPRREAEPAEVITDEEESLSQAVSEDL